MIFSLDDQRGVAGFTGVFQGSRVVGLNVSQGINMFENICTVIH